MRHQKFIHICKVVHKQKGGTGVWAICEQCLQPTVFLDESNLNQCELSIRYNASNSGLAIKYMYSCAYFIYQYWLSILEKYWERFFSKQQSIFSKFLRVFWFSYLCTESSNFYRFVDELHNCCENSTTEFFRKSIFDQLYLLGGKSLQFLKFILAAIEFLNSDLVERCISQLQRMLTIQMHHHQVTAIPIYWLPLFTESFYNGAGPECYFLAGQLAGVQLKLFYISIQYF